MDIFEMIDAKSYGALIKVCKEGKDLNVQNQKGMTPLLMAIGMADHTMVELLLESGANPDFAGLIEIPIVTAILLKEKWEQEKDSKKLEETIQIIGTLLKKEANLNLPTKDGKPVLFLAIEQDNHDLASLLIGHGANLSQQDASGQNAILFVMKRKFIKTDNYSYHYTREVDVTWPKRQEWIKLLLAKGADINVADNQGITPLLSALDQKCSFDFLSFLLQSGANVNVSNTQGQTPLLLAIFQGNEEMVKMMLEKGANVNQADAQGKTPLLLSIFQGKMEISKLLLEKEANVNQADAQGKTPLVQAIEKGNETLVEYLISRGANAQYLWQDRSLTSYAFEQDEISQSTRFKMVGSLVKGGAKINIFDIVEKMCKSRSDEYQRYRQIVENFLQQRNELDVVDNQGQNILHVLARQFSSIYDREGSATELFALAAKNIPNINSQDSMGRTPLHLAVNSYCVHVLLEQGANPNLQDLQGRTPLHYMTLNGDYYSARLLLAHGANIHTADASNITSQQLASMLADIKVMGNEYQMKDRYSGGWLYFKGNSKPTNADIEENNDKGSGADD